MNASVLTIGFSFTACVAVCFLLLSNFACKKLFEEKVLLSSFAVATSVLLSSGIIVLFFWYPYDFVSNLTPLQYILPLLCLPLIFAAFFLKNSYAVPLALLISCSVSVLSANLTIPFFPNAPLYLNKILSIFVFWLFSMSFRAVAGISTLPQIEGITICSGFVLLFLLGQEPTVLACTTAGMLGALLVSYFFNRTAPLGINASPILGYLLGWIGLVAYQELLGSCFLIFAMLYLVEAAFSLLRKATFSPKYKQLAYNSLLLQALQKKIPVASLVKFIMSSNTLLIVIGLFQVVSSNKTSLPLFAAILVVWQLHRAVNWQQEDKTFKETNKEIFAQIKTSFDSLIPLQKKQKKKAGKDKKE